MGPWLSFDGSTEGEEYEPTDSLVIKLSARNCAGPSSCLYVEMLIILLGVLPSQDEAYRDNATSQTELLCYILSRICPTASMATTDL